ncbi:MAG TPA: hypothetical protein VME46_20065 [Acidimicrobiales bacterium]|nr:hypothetical protein [Acidimicrobiales bacterium]
MRRTGPIVVGLQVAVASALLTAFTAVAPGGSSAAAAKVSAPRASLAHDVRSGSGKANTAPRHGRATIHAETGVRRLAGERARPCLTCRTPAGLHVTWQVPDMATVNHPVQTYLEVSTGPALHDVTLRFTTSGAISSFRHGTLASSVRSGTFWAPASFSIARRGAGGIEVTISGTNAAREWMGANTQLNYAFAGNTAVLTTGGTRAAALSAHGGGSRPVAGVGGVALLLTPLERML